MENPEIDKFVEEKVQSVGLTVEDLKEAGDILYIGVKEIPNEVRILDTGKLQDLIKESIVFGEKLSEDKFNKTLNSGRQMYELGLKEGEKIGREKALEDIITKYGELDGIIDLLQTKE